MSKNFFSLERKKFLTRKITIDCQMFMKWKQEFFLLKNISSASAMGW